MYLLSLSQELISRFLYIHFKVHKWILQIQAPKRHSILILYSDNKQSILDHQAQNDMEIFKHV